jgi:hypothetical protein
VPRSLDQRRFCPIKLKSILAFQACPAAEQAARIRHLLAASGLIERKSHFPPAVSAPRELMMR